jgi:hypothetical protein
VYAGNVGPVGRNIVTWNKVYAGNAGAIGRNIDTFNYDFTSLAKIFLLYISRIVRYKLFECGLPRASAVH